MNNSILSENLKAKAISVLHPGPFAKVPHILIPDISFKGHNGISHYIDFLEIRQSGLFYIVLRDKFDQEDAKKNLEDICALQELLGPNVSVYSVVLTNSMNSMTIGSSNIVNISNFRIFMNQFSTLYYSEDELVDIACKISTLVGKPMAIKQDQHIPVTTKFKYCPSCGKKIADYHFKCPSCNYSFESKTVPQKPNHKVENEDRGFMDKDELMLMFYLNSYTNLYNMIDQQKYNFLQANRNFKWY